MCISHFELLAVLFAVYIVVALKLKRKTFTKQVYIDCMKIEMANNKKVLCIQVKSEKTYNSHITSCVAKKIEATGILRYSFTKKPL